MKSRPFPIFLVPVIMILFWFGFSVQAAAQESCQGITFSFEHYEPCRFRFHITDNTSECFPQLRLLIDEGEFISWTANTQDGWTVEQVAPTELLVTPAGGFIPLGPSTPVEFSLPPSTNPILSVLWDDSCPPGLGCLADFPLMSCSDPGNACITGVTYRECGTSPYTNQLTLAGWEIILTNEAGQQVASALTDANGEYLFCDLPAGLYHIREANLPEWWSPSVPILGMYAIDLGESEVAVLNFGNCPSCSCDDIIMDVIPELTGASDTCTFNAILQNSGQYCFGGVDISIDSGLITSWTLHEDHWEVLQLNDRQLRLLPLEGYVPLEFSNPLSWSATGSSAYEITISSSWNDGNGDEVCERSFGYQCPFEPTVQSCCPAGWVEGPELVINGDFSGGNNNFITDYTFSNTPPLNPANYWIGSNPNAINSTFLACPDHTSGNGNMLIAKAGPPPPGSFATIWEQTVNVTPNTSYIFEYWIQNIANSRPVMIFSTVEYYFHFNYFSPPNTPCTWVRYCESWNSGSNTQAHLTIKVVYLTQPGQNFALDDISFRSCGPPCEVDFTAAASGSCGSYQFTDASTHLPANPSYCWDFDGDPSTCESTAPNPVWQFPGCGTYPVCLTLSGTGCPEQVVCQQVTVSDLTAPTAACLPGAMVVLDANCQATVTPNDVAMAFADNCQIASTSVTPNTFSTCGTFPVTVVVADWCSNVTLLSCQVQIKDNTLPTIICPPPFSVECNGPLPPSLTGFATATDNCTPSAQITLAYTDQLFSQINPITQQLCDDYIERTWQATDGCGNISTCVQNISVHDDLLPVLTNCPLSMTVLGTLDAEGLCTAAVQVISPTLTDNCDGSPTLTNSFNNTANASGNYPNGTTTVTWTAMDACGNIATCSSTVTVVCEMPAENCCLEWARQLGGPLTDSGRSLAVDASGQVWTAGTFRGTADFDPGPGVFPLTAAGATNEDIFLTKLDAGGLFLWARQIGGTQIETVNDLVADAAGNIYLTGSFAGSVDFDPGPGTFLLSALGGSDVYVAKLDAAGNFLWAVSVGGSANDAGRALALDPTGNVQLVGQFGNTVDFDPGPGTFPLVAAGISDAFLLYLTAAGTFSGVAQFGGIQSDEATSLAVDPLGNSYLTGVFTSTADFDPGIGVYNLTAAPGFADVFILKLAPAGNLLWAIALSGPNTDAANALALDAQGNVLVTGFFQGTTEFDPGPGTALLTASGAADIFIAKYTGAGTYLWAKNTGGSLGDEGNAVAVDAQSNVYTTGFFYGPADFDPGPGTFILNINSAVARAFIQKLDPSGAFVWAKQLEGTSNDHARDLQVSGNGSIYTTGFFQGTADFEPGPNISSLTAAGQVDAFIYKLGSCTPVDTCYCGGFSDLFLRGPQGALSQPLSCGGPPINIGCPMPGIGFTLTGNFECDGTACPPVADVDWELIEPTGGSVATGITQGPWFGLSLASAYFTQSGVYTLILTGHCGSEICPCVIEFLVEEGCPEVCPCNLEDLISDVNQGFATSFVGNSCRACFSPLGLSDCDEVEWLVDDPLGTPVGTSNANQTFCYTFPGGGTYTVYMNVTRRRSDGSLCESSAKAQAVTVACLLRPVCDNSAFANPGFELEALAGGLNSGGATSGWVGLQGDPLVVEGLPGSHDGWTIQLAGNLDDIAVLSSVEPICLAQDTGTISIRHKVEHWGDPHENLNGKKLIVAFYQGDEFAPQTCPDDNCFRLASIDLSPVDTGWIDLEFPYDLKAWLNPDTCTNPPPGFPGQQLPIKLAIYATSIYSSEQGGNGTRARVQIDNVCLNDLIVGVEELTVVPAIDLFPNPTTGELTLRFNEEIPENSKVQLLDLYGRVVQQVFLEDNSTTSTFRIATLPAGIYFVEISVAGERSWTGKVIKQ